MEVKYKRPAHYVQFTGNFRDLLPDGWKFFKNFARNYRNYRKTADGSEWGQHCVIWQHLGGYMEIDDLFGSSYLIVNLIASGEIESYKRKLSFMKEETYICPTRINTAQYTVLPRYHPDIVAKERAIYAAMDTEPKEVWGALYDEFSKDSRDFTLTEDTVVVIKDLLDRGMIRVVEDTRKFRK